jgi:two-component system sensor histidine kinase CreC
MFIANIREQSQRLKDMIDRLLELARLEHRDGLEDAVPVNLGELANRVIADHAIRMNQRNIDCHCQLASGARTHGEPFLLRQAIANLLDNAIDFSPDGGTIEVTLETADGRHALSVRDQGPGIPDYALPRVFERFYSLDRPGTQRKSTGLGLPFVKEVALLHGGCATVESVGQGGVLARLVLPAI